MGRLICWQLAVLAVFSVPDASRTVKIVIATAVGLTLAATTVRVRDRLLGSWLVRAACYFLHVRSADLDPGGAAAPQLLTYLASHAQLDTVDVDGIPVGVIRRPDGLAAVLELSEPGDTGWAHLLAVESLLPPPDAAGPLFAARVVLQTVPPPVGMLDVNPAAGTGPVWITVHALRTPDVPDDDTLRTALANALHRLLRHLTRDDVVTRTLDRDETVALINTLADLDGDGFATSVPIDEGWGWWQVGDARHVCFRIGGWDELTTQDRQRVLGRLRLVPSRNTTVAITTGTKAAGPQVIVRLCETDPARLESAAGLFAFAVDDLGDDLGIERLDGAHLAGVAASLPLGAATTALGN